MDLISLIKALFVPRLIKETTISNGQLEITMKETNEKAKTKKVIIKGLPEKSIALKLDEIDPNILKNFLLGKKGEVARCDYVLFIQENNNNIECNNKFIYFIELKSNNLKKQKVKNQLKSSYCLIKYCSMLAENFHNNNILNDFKDRYLVIKRQSINKRNTKPKGINWSINSSSDYATINLSPNELYISYNKIK